MILLLFTTLVLNVDLLTSLHTRLAGFQEREGKIRRHWLLLLISFLARHDVALPIRCLVHDPTLTPHCLVAVAPKSSKNKNDQKASLYAKVCALSAGWFRSGGAKCLQQGLEESSDANWTREASELRRKLQTSGARARESRQREIVAHCFSSPIEEQDQNMTHN